MRNQQVLQCLTPRAAMSRSRAALIAPALLVAFSGGLAEAAMTGAEVVKAQCGRCHEAGTAGAPKPGDKAAWAPRFSKGVDALVLTAIRGHGGMPPRGGKADLTDAELRGAILYMFNTTGPTKESAKSAAAAPTGAGLHHMLVGGLDIYLGRVSAERMRAYPANSPEAKMHGGIPGEAVITTSPSRSSTRPRRRPWPAPR